MCPHINSVNRGMPVHCFGLTFSGTIIFKILKQMMLKYTHSCLCLERLKWYETNYYINETRIEPSYCPNLSGLYNSLYYMGDCVTPRD